MDAHVYLDKSGSWMVSLRVFSREVDEAGPFEDQADAVMAAERCVYGEGSVVIGGVPYQLVTSLEEHPHVELEAA